MYPELISIWGFVVYSYSLFLALGFLLGLNWILRRSSKSAEQLLRILLITFFSGIIGARIFYIIQFWPQFQESLWQVFNLRGGGLVFYGSIITGLPTLFMLARRHKISFLNLLDLVIPAFFLGYAIGRLGCFFNGCCYGEISTLPWAVNFPEVSSPRHPTQIYAFLVSILFFLFLQRKWKRGLAYRGQLAIWGFHLYAVDRFFIEFLRVNPLYFGLSAAQWFSLLLSGLGISLYIYLRNFSHET